MDNRKNIIEKGLLLFSQRGYAAVGIQEICVECDVTKPTLYHYFGSKRGLLEAIVERFYPPFLEKVTAAAEYHRDIIMNLESIAKVFMTLAVDEPVFTRFLLVASYSPEESDLHAAQKTYSEKISATIRTLFEQAVNEHGNMRGREYLLSLSFRGLLQSYCGFVLNKDITVSDQVVYAVVKQFMYGIFS